MSPASDESPALEVEARDETGALRRFGGTVSLKYPPVVVRTGPTRGAVDVGLSALIRVVFSEPVDEQTVSPETIELTLGGQGVPAEVTSSPDGLRAEVKPRGLLPDREYTLVVTTGVRDRDGLNLRQEYRSTFSTLNAPAVASIAIAADSLNVELGRWLTVTATLVDSLGNRIPESGARVTAVLAAAQRSLASDGAPVVVSDTP